MKREGLYKRRGLRGKVYIGVFWDFERTTGLSREKARICLFSGIFIVRISLERVGKLDM